MRSSNRRVTALAVASLWLVNGLITGSLSAKLPELAERLDLSEGQLGLALLGQTVGLVVVIFALAPRLVHRFGARRIALVAGGLYCVSFAAPGYVQGLAALFAALLVIGAFNAPLDITMGELGGALEERWKARLMSRFEFAFNGGLVVAAAIAWAVADRITLPGYMTAIAALGVVMILAATPWLPDSARGEAPRREQSGRVGFPRSVSAMALIAAAGLWCEATVLDWMGLFYVRTLDAEPAQYAIGLLCFVVGLMASLWAGNRLVDRLGAVRLVRIGAVAFAAGLLATLLSGSLVLADAGLFLAGAGLANAHPLALSAARRAGGPTALAKVAGTSYVGLVAAKPVIGGLAELTSLTVALALGALAAIVLVAAASVLRQADGVDRTAGPTAAVIAVDRFNGEDAVVVYGNRPGELVVVADLSGSGPRVAEATAALVEAVSNLARPDDPLERILVRVAGHVNPKAPEGRVVIDAGALTRIADAAESVEGIVAVGEPVLDFVAGRGWRAVIAATTSEAMKEWRVDRALQQCAVTVGEAVGELAEVIVCREVRPSGTA